VKPKLLDLYCKAGGSSMGYHRAGFEVTGVDNIYQKRYPFNFIQADAVDILKDHTFLRKFDVIAASPPCQTHSITKFLTKAQGGALSNRKNMIPATREGLMMANRPWIMENVEYAPLKNPILVCGSAFGLKVRRHRIFETGEMSLVGTSCYHKEQGRVVGVYGQLRDSIPGGGKTAETVEEAQEAMRIDWMIWSELVEAIPPAYTEFLGKQIIQKL